MRKFIVGAAVALMGAGAMSGTAFAGEITGNGKPTPPSGYVMQSICAFSGLDDGSEGGVGGPGEAPQNWGQIPKAVRDIIATQGEHPGDACNGHTGFLAGGGEEG